jgi:succinylarginine dihydrolase
MRRRWFAIAAVATAFTAVGVQAASAASTQLSHFETIDGTFAKADHTWTAALENLSANATVAQVSKPSVAFVPAIKTFDTALAKLGFSGKTATVVATVIKLNGELIADISSIKSTKGFITQFSALSQQYLTAQTSLAKDLGIEAADVQV